MEVLDFLFVDNTTVVSSYPDVCTVCFMYLAVPVTAGKAERCFRNENSLKTIYEYHESGRLERLRIVVNRKRKS